MQHRRSNRAGKITSPQSSVRTSWDPVANWYDGWVGPSGSRYHRLFALPAVLSLLTPEPGESILDVGCGQGVLAPHIAQAGAAYTGVDASAKLISLARKTHARHGRFLRGDARQLKQVAGIDEEAFDAAVFMLSIQDMDPLDAVIGSTAWAVRPRGRIVIFMTHPCFRVPRQSGWGWDDQRKLRFRRVDRYLTPLDVPMKTYETGTTTRSTRSFHRPLHLYIEALSRFGLSITQFREIPESIGSEDQHATAAERVSAQEFPLFLGIAAKKR